MNPLIILCAGPSIEELARNVEKFKNVRIPYLLINGYAEIFNNTFGKLGLAPNYVSAYADRDWHMDEKTLHLCNSSGTCFITNEMSYTEKIRRKIRDYEIFCPDVDATNPERRTNSLIKVMVHMWHKGYNLFFIYGCDGYVGDGPIYYNGRGKAQEATNKIRDTKDINSRMWDLLLDHGCFPVHAFICNIKSHLTCFPRITIEQSLRLIHGL